MFEGKIRDLGTKLSTALLRKSAELRALGDKHPESKNGLVLRASVLSDVALVIQEVTNS